jgi:hypothetical protein
MSSEQPSPANKAAERLAVIVDAAERAALSVIDDAEKEAGRYLEEARVKADRIVAEKLRETADLLEAGDGDAPPPAERQPALAAVADEAGGGSAAARLVATEMAVSGSSRKEIEKRLRNGFEIEDTKSILDAILGPEE